MKRHAAFVSSPAIAGRRRLHNVPAFHPTPFQSHHKVSLTRIQATSLINAGLRRLPSPITATAFLLALLMGYILGRRRAPRRTLFPLQDNTTTVQPVEVSTDGVTPLWLNYGIRKLWKLVQKNTKQFAQEAIQPVLDDTDKPDFVQDVRLVQYTVGKKAPVIRDLRPVPARSLAEVQCTFQMQFQSTSDLKFEVDVSIPDTFNKNKTITIPVSLSNLQMDALMWSAFTLAPYQPYFTTWRFSLLKTPRVAFDMNVASALPVTAVPGLRSLFFRIIRQEIPKDFMFPLSNTVDFTPDKERAKKREFMNLTVEEIDQLSEDEIQDYCPKEWALYNSLDLDHTGSLEKQDLARGLSDWGYSTQDAEEYFEKLDEQHEGVVSFSQFCMMWPNVTTTEIAKEYEGMLSLSVGEATNLSEPIFGWSNPVLSISVGNETVTSRLKEIKDDQIFLCNDDLFEIPCEPLDHQKLQILIKDDTKLALGGANVIGTANLPLDSLYDSPVQSLNLDLEPQGTVQLDLSYTKFVDQWDVCIEEEDEEEEVGDDDESGGASTTTTADQIARLSNGRHNNRTLSHKDEDDDVNSQGHTDGANKMQHTLESLMKKSSSLQKSVHKLSSRVVAKAKSTLERIRLF